MAGAFGRILAGTWLVGSMLWAPIAGAQAGRPWSDPPADLNAGPLVQDTAAEAASTKPAQAWPDEAARRQPARMAEPRTSSDPKETGSTRSAEPRRVRDVQTTGSTQVSGKAEGSEPPALSKPARKETASRKTREARPEPKSHVASVPQKRRTQTARASDPERVRTAQRAEYEVMRMRTLLYPDGRVVEVLTRPDQEFVDFPLR